MVNYDSQNLNVVLVSGFDPSRESASGVQTYVLGLAKSLARKGINVKMLGIGDPGVLKSYNVDFIPIQEKGSTSIRFLVSLMAASPSIRFPKDTIIHTHRPDDLAPLCVSHPENPKVVTMHGSHADSVRMSKGSAVGRLYDEIEAYALRKTDSIICISQETLSRLKAKYPKLTNRMHLVYAGIDTDLFKPIPKREARRKLNLREDGKIILYAGRLVNEKRVDIILKAYKEIENGSTEASLIITGEGQQKPHLRALASDLKLVRITFRPVAPKSELPLLLCAADLTVIASKKEGLPTIAMESLACGTPVVSTPVGIVPEIIKDGVNGHIVTDISNLARIIGKALATSSNMSKNCPESVRRFSWDIVVKEVMAVYNEVANKS